ncbi:MAG: FxsA family protein [Pseudomonadota bacterium]
MPLLIAIIGMSFIEIALFIWVGGMIGIGWTLLAIVATAVTGVALIRHQGVQVLAEARAAAERNEPPLKSVFDGFCLLVAGLFLLTPGFFTDFLGFLLLIPPLRRAMGRRLWDWAVRTGRLQTVSQRYGGGGPTVDGEAQEIKPDDPSLPPLDESRWGGSGKPSGS